MDKGYTNMSQPTIRPYHPKDKTALITILRLNSPAYFAPEEEEGFDQYLDHGTEDYFVICVDDVPVGCGGINYEDEKTTGIISWDMIHPDFQKQSLGSRLLQYRIDKLKAMPDIRKIIVRTSQLTDRYYQKMGFKLLNVVENHWAEGYHLYLMEYSK